MSKAPLPRLLHSGVKPIGTADSSGVTLASLFGDWPDELLLQLCLRDAPVERDFGSLAVVPPKAFPLNWAAHTVLRGRTIRADHHLMHNAVSLGTSHVPLKTRVKRLARDVNAIGPVHLGRGLRHRVGEFRPQVVHSLLGTVREMRMALALSRAFEIPILPHFTDDWPSTIYGDGQLLGAARAEASRLLTRIIDRSPVLLTIGTDMASEFARRYDKPTVVVGNSIDVPPLTGSRSPNTSLVYAGGLHLGRADIIANLAAALDRSDGAPLTIDLYTGPNDRPLTESLAARYRSIRAQGFLLPDAVLPTLESSFAALFVESPEQRILDYTRLSVSTKVPEYLAARTPIVALGPPSQASVRELVSAPQTVYAGDGSDLERIAAALAMLRKKRAEFADRAEFPMWYSRTETCRRFADAAAASVSQWAAER